MRILFGAALAFLLVSSAAQAAKMAVVVRGSGAGSDKAAGFVDHFARDIFSRDRRYEVVDVSQQLGNPERERAEQAFVSAEELVKKGREAYDSLELDPAVEHLSAAVGMYERNAAYVRDFSKVSSALMLLGAAYILRGEDKVGARYLDLAVTVYPDVEPDPRVFNPGMRQIFQGVSEKVKTRARGTLSVNSNPGYAEIYVDGNFFGITPMAVEDLAEGRHYVSVVKDGYRAWGKLVDVSSRPEAADAAETATLKPTTHMEDYNGLVDGSIAKVNSEGRDSKGATDSLDQLGVLVNADHIFLAQVKLDGEKVVVSAGQYDLNAQRLLKSATQTFAYDAKPKAYEREIGDLIRTQFSVDSLMQSPKTASAGGGAKAEEGELVREGIEDCVGPNCDRSKLWALVIGGGAGAALMGGGIWLWTRASSDNDKYCVRDPATGGCKSGEPQVSPKSAQLRSSGKKKALWGDILFFTGVASAVVGIGMYLFWEPSTAVSQVSSSGSGWGITPVPLVGGGGFSLTGQF